jgi:NADH-quinone oxidoreductase subunit N
MNTPQYAVIVPLIVVAATIVALTIAIAIRRSHRTALVVTLAGLAIAFAYALRLPSSADAGPLLVVDSYAGFYLALIIAATAAVALLSFEYLERMREQREEFYMLLLLAALGALILVAARHFAAFFLGLELLSLSLYALIAYPRTGEAAVEAGLKYLVLAAASAAFVLFGMALVYAEAGALDLARAATPPATGPGRIVALAGIALILVGFGFKLALVPFHLWTPDVYQGAPAPVTAFVATVSKGAMVALLLRLFAGIDVAGERSLFVAFAVVAIASMIAGNLLALLQNHVKRLLAYSSIAHLGYIIVAFLASGALAATAVTFYLVTYFITMIGAFGVITVLSESRDGDLDRLADFRGLFVRRPWLATTMGGMLLSLAGIPLTGGFVGKFYVTVAAGSAALWALLVVMMITSGIGLFYYLRVVVAMFMQPEGEPAARVAVLGTPFTAGVTLAGLAVLLVWLGVYPAPMMSRVREAVAQIGLPPAAVQMQGAGR